MTAPFTLPLDLEVWADREEELEQLFAKLAHPQTENEGQSEPEGAR